MDGSDEKLDYNINIRLKNLRACVPLSHHQFRLFNGGEPADLNVFRPPGQAAPHFNSDEDLPNGNTSDEDLPSLPGSPSPSRIDEEFLNLNGNTSDAELPSLPGSPSPSRIDEEFLAISSDEKKNDDAQLQHAADSSAGRGEDSGSSKNSLLRFTSILTPKEFEDALKENDQSLIAIPSNGAVSSSSSSEENSKFPVELKVLKKRVELLQLILFTNFLKFQTSLAVKENKENFYDVLREQIRLPDMIDVKEMTLDSLKTELERNNAEIDNYKKQNAEIDKYCELNSNDPTFLILVISVLFSRLLLLLQILRFLGLKQKCEELPESSEDPFYINLLQKEPFNFPDPSRMSFEALDDTLDSLKKKIDETQLHINDLNVKFLRIRAEKTWLPQENLHVVRASSLETSLGDLDKEQRYRRHLSRKICGLKEDIKSNSPKKKELINALKERIELNKRSIGVVSQKLNNISSKLRNVGSASFLLM